MFELRILFRPTFTRITGSMGLGFSIDLLVFNGAHEVMWYSVITELGFRLTKVQYNGCNYCSCCNTFYNINTVTLGIHIEINKSLLQ